jgi:hypothetical protein
MKAQAFFTFALVASIQNSRHFENGDARLDCTIMSGPKRS